MPALVEVETFELAQEQLEKNKRHAARRTLEPTLLQGMLVCARCGYALYRTSTRTSKRKLYYYRCLGSDRYRHLKGRVCPNRPLRQDYLDEKVWTAVMKLLQDPELVRAEIERRIRQIQQSHPRKQREESLARELTRVTTGIGKLVDAYQEGLIQLEELRLRVPQLRQRQKALESQLSHLKAADNDEEAFLRLADFLDDFLSRLRRNADSLSVTEQQRVLRLVVKEILVGEDTITIKHSILDRRHAQRALLSVGFVDPHAAHGCRSVALVFQLRRQFAQPLLLSVLLDTVEGLSVHPRCSAVGFAFAVGGLQHIFSPHLVVKLMEATFGLLLRFGVQRPLQLPNFSRSSQAPSGQSPRCRFNRRLP